MYNAKPFIRRIDNIIIVLCEILFLANLIILSMIGGVQFINMGADFSPFPKITDDAVFQQYSQYIFGTFSGILCLCLLVMTVDFLIFIGRNCYRFIKWTKCFEKKKKIKKREEPEILKNLRR